MNTILITGCSSGIGYDTAKQLHEKGWRVFASCRRAEDVARLQSEGLADALLLDVTDSAQIEAAFAHILAQTGGRLDVLFCNAGYGQVGAVEDIPRIALHQQFNTNVFGTWECITHAMKIFRRQGRGRVLINSSILGFAAMPWRGAYNSSKFALEGL
ncbi:MAG TPA: SDR family NAD(P)-dependent oxidoreductase, partial [Neisseria sp.]|nr:SDR family NAD(P)-dependent oxidoreductase [Neisseria sp.]